MTQVQLFICAQHSSKEQVISVERDSVDRQGNIQYYNFQTFECSHIAI